MAKFELYPVENDADILGVKLTGQAQLIPLGMTDCAVGWKTAGSKLSKPTPRSSSSFIIARTCKGYANRPST
jgi:hypothetical protein